MQGRGAIMAKVPLARLLSVALTCALTQCAPATAPPISPTPILSLSQTQPTEPQITAVAAPHGITAAAPPRASAPEAPNLATPASRPSLESAPLAAAAHTPIRAPTYGQGCDCPYDIASNGSRCGGRSAWSRPGG